HCHLYPAQLHGTLAAYLAGVPAVTTMHRLEPMRPGSLLLPVLTGSWTIAVCRAVKDLMTAHGVSDRLVEVIYNAVTAERFEPTPNAARELRDRLVGADVPVVGTVARLSPEK